MQNLPSRHERRVDCRFQEIPLHVDVAASARPIHEERVHQRVPQDEGVVRLFLGPGRDRDERPGVDAEVAQDAAALLGLPALPAQRRVRADEARVLHRSPTYKPATVSTAAARASMPHGDVSP